MDDSPFLCKMNCDRLLFWQHALLWFVFIAQNFRTRAILHYATWNLHDRIVSLPFFVALLFVSRLRMPLFRSN